MHFDLSVQQDWWSSRDIMKLKETRAKGTVSVYTVAHQGFIQGFSLGGGGGGGGGIL